MKRLLTSLGLAVAFSALTTASLHAQTLSAIYKVPFSFNAMGKHLPAGIYGQSDLSGHKFAMLRNEGGPSVIFMTPNAMETQPGSAELVFDRCGDKYFLRQVWNRDGQGSTIPMSSEEREIRNSHDQAMAMPSQVTVVAGR